MSESEKVTVLVVEDEYLIRWDLADSLEAAGYRVLEAPNADAAMKILEGDRTIRVVFTDIRMPGTLDGIQLAHCIRKRWPPTIIVVSSGNIPPDASVVPTGVRLLAKPYDRSALKAVCNDIAAELSA